MKIFESFKTPRLDVSQANTCMISKNDIILLPSFVVLLKPRLVIYQLGKYAKGNVVFLRQFSNHLSPKE